MAGTRITNLQTAAKQPLLIQPPQPPQRSTATQGAVQLRIKSSQSSGDRLSQSKSMVLQESDLPQKPISRHRRNQSQHSVFVAGGGGGAGFEPSVDLKGEHLNVAKISESGKKQRKNWTLMWTVLTSDQLLFYKERQQETSQKPGSKTDVVPLCGAVIEWTTEKSSKKNVFHITANTGSEYLLQADSYSTASKWHDAIRKAVDSSTKADGGFPLRRSNSTEYLPRHSSLPGYGSASASASTNTKQHNIVHRRSINVFGSSKLKHSASDSADKNGVKNRLKKFIIRRPSMKTLQEKGLIKDRVFGCHLLTLCEREGTTVPKFVQICLDAVDKRGLDADGIYRVSGNLATIQKLRFIVDQEEDLDLDHSQWEDVHVVTGALKMFFRELPEPLFPFRFFQPFVEAIKMKESKQKVQAVKKLIQELPRPNQDTMKLLFSHLHRVLAFSKKNLMSTQGIGIVFGPTLMWPELDAGNMAFNMVYQNQIVEFILCECEEIFNLGKK
ncbi:rho GTPase-activating protein 15 isoform X2 [Micropterus dolomieu]|uniref:rho GTPase-activating protein 15 isoform X1 n=1 Tax=Micropterus dolomieu TaxID=147949 RepID=UPI001E8DEC5B|nr:rho GTPase-activating protein 15 isoform X1 [Micropterus dolomieu]XP_045911047.1 rho GTPase-activating protein 15 isoform X2 [Micropterus dolomieu]